MDLSLEKTESYEHLKQNILEKIGECDASELKINYKQYIESDRTFNTVHSIKELVAILEDRDILNEDRLTVFYEIFFRLQEQGLLDQDTINELEGQITLYKKVYECLESEVCLNCSETLFVEERVPLTPTAPQLTPAPSEQTLFKAQRDREPFSEIDAMISFVSEHIGKDWRALASFLHVQERKITDIHYLHGEKDAKLAAFAALGEWKTRSRRKTVDMLKEELIKCLRQESVYFHTQLAEDIENGEHLEFWRHLLKH